MSPNRGEHIPSGSYESPDPLPERPLDDSERATESPAAAERPANRPATPVPAQPTSQTSATQIIQTDDTVQPDNDLTAATTADSDRIEKQWIDRVKNVVRDTKDDPHKQKQEMSRVKAEYIKKRFNKTIKTDAGAA